VLKKLLGTKVGMTQIYDSSGKAVPVTVIAAGPCYVIRKKTVATDGYNALQLGFGDRPRKVNKPKTGYFVKANATPNSIPVKYLKEFRVNDIDKWQVGQEIKADTFVVGDHVDVRSRTKGHGFSGVVKRYNFAGGPSTHGQSDRQRAPGTSGGQEPQRVIRGKRMPGHYGYDWCTIQNLRVEKVDAEKNLLLLRGAVPGANRGLVLIEKSVKKEKVVVVVKKDDKAKKKKG